MLEITPWGLVPENYNLRNEGVDCYTGPGLAITHVEIDGPIVDEFPSRGHELLFAGINRQEVEPGNPKMKTKPWYVPKFKVVTEDPLASARTALGRIANQAFRREVSSNGIQPYADLFQGEFEASGDFETSLRSAVAAIFCSPDFLYLRETPGWLDSYAIANRLSYFLIRTSPDASLQHVADDDAIAKCPQVILKQTQRLIDDPKFERFIEDFCDAWLNLRDLEFTSPDQNLFPEYDAYLLHSMKEETRRFVRHAIRENRPVNELVNSPVAMINQRLADHYQIDDVVGPEIRPVRLAAGSVRGGLLGQASILKVSANGTNTSPVVRGVWVTERLIGINPPPPPPGIPGVEPDIRGASTLRDMLDKHRNSDTCRSCHALIDPPGFALESFNPIGGWRDRYRSLGKGDKVDLQINNRRVRYKMGLPVDASGETNDGTAFEGFAQFRDWLAGDKNRLARAMITKWLTFATGREMGFSDRPVIEKLVEKSKSKNHGLRDMIQLVVTSEIFRRK